MYGTGNYGYGSVSGMIHLVARRPMFAAVVVLAAVSVASIPKAPPPPPTPLPPAVVTFSAAPEQPAADSERATSDPGEQAVNYSCVFAKNTPPTNLCKATLDSIALYLNNHDTASIELTGSMDHVIAVQKYFTEGESKFGIRPGRIHLHVEGTDKDNTVAIEQVP